jgi:hypothetical protein
VGLLRAYGGVHRTSLYLIDQDSPASAAKPTDFDGLKEYLRQNPDKAELVMNSLDVSALGLDRG